MPDPHSRIPHAEDHALDTRHPSGGPCGCHAAIAPTRFQNESDERLHALINATPDFVCFKDGEGRWLETNEAGLDLLRLREVEYRGMTDAELAPHTHPIHRDALLNCETSDARSWRLGGQSRGIEEIPTACGQIKVYDVIKVPLYQPDGGRKGLVVLGRDITEQRHAETALERHAALLDKRLREMRCLYQVASLLDSPAPSLAELARGVLELLPAAWQYPEITCARLTLHPDVIHATANFQPTPWLLSQSLDGGAGWIEIGYLHARPGADEGPFLREERALLDEIARRIGEALRRRVADARLRQAATVFESTLEGVMITDTAGRIVAVNRAFTDITGYSETEALDRTPRLLHSDRHDAEFYRRMWAGIEELGYWRGEIWNRRKNGEIYPEWQTISAVRDAAGTVLNYVGVFSDISQMKQSEQRLEHLAHHDALTDLPNRMLLNVRLAHALERAQRQGQTLALLHLDLDRFKTVNDSLGHPVGDELLVAITRRIAERVRDECTLARVGGDEFVVLLENPARPEDAAVLASELIALLNEAFTLAQGQEIYVGASIGISLYPNDAGDATQLIRNADAALHQAKEHGRNTYRFYTEALTEAAHARLALETKLRRALERQELVLHFQPQVACGDGRSVAVEALLRWQHPEKGLIAPLEFIPLAEETGLIVPLGAWVLSAACAQLRVWIDAGLTDLGMAVNLSSRQFRAPDLVDQVRAALDAAELPGHMLELEITESSIMEQGEQATATLQALKALGVRLAIDDFGTGYSSLAYLKRFPIDTLKIDRGFVRDIPSDSNDKEIAATIIAMARNLKLSVLAEGVENAAQFDFLRQQGCDLCQGYLFSQALPAEETENLLRARAVA